MPAPPPRRAVRPATTTQRPRLGRPPRAAPDPGQPTPPPESSSSGNSRPPPNPVAESSSGSGAGNPRPPPNPVADPAATVVWGGRLPSRRRLVSSAAAATAIVIGGNLGGVTSALLSSTDAAAAAARAAQLDVILPIRGAKRALGDGYTFTYPAAWLADRTVAERRAAAGERSRALDPPPLTGGGPAAAAPPLPDAAFGPPDTAGETNVSVIVAPIMAGFTLAASLGPPAAAGAKFLETVIAPPGSPRTATLLAAAERTDAGGTAYYTWTYRVAGPGFDRTNVSCLAARAVVRPPGPPNRAFPPGGTPRLELVTLNAVAPTAAFEADPALAASLRESAASLVVRERVLGRTGL